MDVDAVMAEQIAYYRARAAEYDRWWGREGPYAQGEQFERWWRTEIAALWSWVSSLGPLGDVLELAAGTGNLTRILAPSSASILALDSSPETLEINAAKNVELPVTFVVGDVFAWESERTFDTIAFGFWLSHVPVQLFERFWSRVGRWLGPGGRVLVVENQHHESYQVDRPRRQTDAEYDLEAGTSRRTLEDGRTFDIIKVFHQPDELRQRLAALGWKAEIGLTNGAFLHGVATRS